MLKYELKKYIGVLAFMFCIFGIGYFLVLLFHHNSIEMKVRQYYQEYINLLQGPLNQEKESYIADEYKRVNTVIENATDNIQYNQQIDFHKLDYALEHEKAWQMIYDRYLYLKDTENIKDRVFYNELDLQDYFKSSEINYFELLLLVIIALYAATGDFCNGRLIMIKSTYRGNLPYILAKQNILIAMTACTSALFSLIEFIYIAVSGNLSMLTLPVKSMINFSDLEQSMTIGAYMTLRCINHMIWCIVTVLIMSMIGLLTKKLQTGLFIGIFTIIIPLALKDVFSQKLLIWMYGIHLDKEFTLCNPELTSPETAAIYIVAVIVVYNVNALLWKTAKI